MVKLLRENRFCKSETALIASKEEILKSFGKEYHFERQFKTKSKSAQEAHEAIRPTYFNVQKIDGDNQKKNCMNLFGKEL